MDQPMQLQVHPLELSHRGQCLCGAVTFSILGDLPAPDACHCRQCRAWSGHYFASTDVLKTALVIEQDGDLRWYASSAKVRRGFCAQCGSSLFWDPIEKTKIAVAMGALQTTTRTLLGLHIFVAEKGDYYGLDDCLPQHL
jgi:hypothetical protein